MILLNYRESRYVWTLELNEKLESKWEGFETPEECLNNLFKKFEKYKIAKDTKKYNL